MQALQNKQIVADAMHALAQGDMRPFYDAWADDVVWRQMAVSGPWSQAFRGKAAASEQLFIPLRAQYADRYTNMATNVLADGDHVVVECRGAVTLKNGRHYGNQYCFVIRMADGKMLEVREYLDTALANDVLEPV